MIFRKKPKLSPDAAAEPQTRIDPFPGSSSAKSSPFKNRMKKERSGKGPTKKPKPGARAEPPTRDAVFAKDEVLNKPANPAPNRDDPPVGWLVVVEGPGRGFSAPLKAGDNSIGRDGSSHVRLDFGDAELAEIDHANINYDPKKRRFHLTKKSTSGRVILGDKSVGKAPRRLMGRNSILLGRTQLLFIAVCDESFDWTTSDI